MQAEIRTRYLVFPVNQSAVIKTLRFSCGGECLYQLQIRLDNRQPDFYAYIDVSRYLGQTLELTVSPDMELMFEEADERKCAGLYQEELRPQIHFTAAGGWLNDPNGLIWLDGKYHMFFQYNPAEPAWNNMHWGHAVSTDLLHWKEEPVALYPDGRGMMFSGCALLDERNLLGRNQGEKKAALLFYTTTDPYVQNLSYSTDDFRSIQEYEGNPVVPHIAGENRDPKVVWCEELDCYLMALYLVKNIYGLFITEDLVHYQELQRITLEGDCECPDIFPIQDQHGNRKWVLLGASDRYLVGTFQEGRFVAEQPVRALHYGNSSYAGQSFANLQDGRVIRMVWDRWSAPVHSFCGQMGIPMEVTLSEQAGSYHLEVNPVKELQTLCRHTVQQRDLVLKQEEGLQIPLEEGAYLVKLKRSMADSGQLECRIFGRSLYLDFEKQEMRIGPNCAPLSVTGGQLDLTIVVDRCSREVFADGGRIYLTCLSQETLNDYNLPYLELLADREMEIEELTLHSLASVW